jgi:hypothetical protein
MVDQEPTACKNDGTVVANAGSDLQKFRVVFMRRLMRLNFVQSDAADGFRFYRLCGFGLQARAVASWIAEECCSMEVLVVWNDYAIRSAGAREPVRGALHQIRCFEAGSLRVDNRESCGQIGPLGAIRLVLQSRTESQEPCVRVS